MAVVSGTVAHPRLTFVRDVPYCIAESFLCSVGEVDVILLTESVDEAGSLTNEFRNFPRKPMKRILAVFTFALMTVSLAAAQRLPEVAAPENYKLTFTPDLEKATFEGDETISIRVLKQTSKITLNATDIDFHDVTITSGRSTQKAKVTPDKDKQKVNLAAQKPLSAGAATIHITYTSILNSEMRAL